MSPEPVATPTARGVVSVDVDLGVVFGAPDRDVSILVVTATAPPELSAV
jgi:hypothetical protein